METSQTTVVVCGSRDWTDKDWIADVLADLTTEPNVEIIHGAARGADTLAAEVAELYGFTVRPFPADWRTHGKRAGVLRNLAMLDEKPDRVIAFQRYGSRGTQHTIDEARRRGIPVQVEADHCEHSVYLDGRCPDCGTELPDPDGQW